MKNVRCSLGTGKDGYFINTFKMTKNLRSEVEKWARSIGESGMLLKAYVSDESGIVYNSQPMITTV